VLIEQVKDIPIPDFHRYTKLVIIGGGPSIRKYQEQIDKDCLSEALVFDLNANYYLAVNKQLAIAVLPYIVPTHDLTHSATSSLFQFYDEMKEMTALLNVWVLASPLHTALTDHQEWTKTCPRIILRPIVNPGNGGTMALALSSVPAQIKTIHIYDKICCC